MANEVTAASAIKAMRDFVRSLSKEEWERLRLLCALEFCGMVKYDAEGGGSNGK